MITIFSLKDLLGFGVAFTVYAENFAALSWLQSTEVALYTSLRKVYKTDILKGRRKESTYKN